MGHDLGTPANLQAVPFSQVRPVGNSGYRPPTVKPSAIPTPGTSDKIIPRRVSEVGPLLAQHPTHESQSSNTSMYRTAPVRGTKVTTAKAMSSPKKHHDGEVNLVKRNGQFVFSRKRR